MFLFGEGLRMWLKPLAVEFTQLIAFLTGIDGNSRGLHPYLYFESDKDKSPLTRSAAVAFKTPIITCLVFSVYTSLKHTPEQVAFL